MKRALIAFALLMAGLSVSAQTPKLLVNPFQINGAMTIFWETEYPDDMREADLGCKWHLEQKGSGDEKVVSFWIDMPDPRLRGLNKTTWKNAAVVLTEVGEQKLKMYVVRDAQFRHLTIAEYERGKFLVQLCSVVER